MQSHALTEGLTFTEEDMESVRQGILTSEQADKLRQLQQPSYFVKLGCVGLIFLMLACFGLVLYSVIASSPASPTGRVANNVMPLLLLMIGIFVVSFMVLGFQLQRFRQDLAARHVASVTGPATINIVSPTGGSRSNYLEINGLRFPTTTWLYQLEEPDAIYHVYYLPRSKALVTIERASS